MVFLSPLGFLQACMARLAPSFPTLLFRLFAQGCITVFRRHVAVHLWYWHSRVSVPPHDTTPTATVQIVYLFVLFLPFLVLRLMRLTRDPGGCRSCGVLRVRLSRPSRPAVVRHGHPQHFCEGDDDVSLCGCTWSYHSRTIKIPQHVCEGDVSPCGCVWSHLSITADQKNDPSTAAAKVVYLSAAAHADRWFSRTSSDEDIPPCPHFWKRNKHRRVCSEKVRAGAT